jgi:hypothetical protein
LATTFLWSQSLLAQSASAEDEEPLRSETRSATTAESAIAPPASQQPTTDDQRPSTKSRDNWVRATQLLGAAKAGDSDAQYHLFAVINWCDTILDHYFTTDGRQLTLDEGLEKAPNASQKRQAQEEFPHCRRFREHNVAFELGSAEYWLERATQNGQPLAQAETARRILYQDSMNTNVPLFGNQAAGISVSIPSGAPPNRRAVDLLRAAVKSLEPQVLEIIGGAQTELHGSRMAEVVDRYAWLYVACQRGADCSPTSHWATDCSDNCDVSTPEGIVKGWSRDEWPAVQQRANEINAKLDAGKWDELGLGR